MNKMNELNLIYPCYNNCYYDSGFIDGYMLGIIAIILLISMVGLITIDYKDMNVNINENKKNK